MLFVARIAAAIAALVACVWAVRDPKFDSYVAALGMLSLLAAAFVVPKLIPNVLQKQTLSGRSTGIQSAGDVNVGNISSGDQPADKR